MPRVRSIARFGVALLAATLLSGCVAYPVDPYYGGTPAYYAPGYAAPVVVVGGGGYGRGYGGYGYGGGFHHRGWR